MYSQHAFGDFDHDSVQYHFYCGDIMGAGRLFSTRTLEHGSLWIFDGAQYHELQSVTGKFHDRSDRAFEADIGQISLRQNGSTITIHLEGMNGKDDFKVVLTPATELRWSDTISQVIHQPDMAVELHWNGQVHDGIGYCKRYSWTPAPNYWGYRFIQGFLDDGAISIWTAEATFGTGKYDYFRMLMPDGDVITTPDDISCHRLNGAFAKTSIGPVNIQLEELCVWQAPLRSERMDSLLRQRACRMTVTTDNWQKHGLAINETCYGTLG